MWSVVPQTPTGLSQLPECAQQIPTSNTQSVTIPLTLQRGVTSTGRHAARSHSFVYISTSYGANVIRLLRACS